MGTKRYFPQEVHRYCLDIFQSAGLESKDAQVAADSLVNAELEGAKSHGISRISIYAKRLLDGRINGRPNFQVADSHSLLKVNGDNGLGQVVANYALGLGISKAKKQGISGVFISNSNHFGTAAFFGQKACNENMAFIGMTNSPSAIAPWGGKQAFFGTNPIAFCFPVENKAPVIIDMSSSVAARGNIILAEKQGNKIPLHWALDKNGVPTDDPAEALMGSVLPFGGAKGYALALAVEMFCSILSSAAFGPHVNNIYTENAPHANVGHSFILIDLESLVGMEAYYENMNHFIKEIKENPQADEHQEILYPGERRHRTYTKNVKEGIALSPSIVKELEELGEGLGVIFPREMSMEGV
ncbi:malate dehydrogenase (NAD) [Bacillus sp. OV194]|nr:malate dehydrogenase (NAD) [Bacillus sp. OV194]